MYWLNAALGSVSRNYAAEVSFLFIGGKSGGVYLISVGQAEPDQGTLPEVNRSRLHVLVRYNADGWW